MNAEIKAQWLKDLRSGEYAQTRSALCKLGKKYDSFCCLGVLADQAVRAGIAKVRERPDDVGVLAYEDNTSSLQAKILKWAGLPENSPLVDVNFHGNKASLASLNDHSHLSFK